MNWIIDAASEVFIGPLNEAEDEEVARVLTSHGNKFRRTSVMLFNAGLLQCTYEEFLIQAAGGPPPS